MNAIVATVRTVQDLRDRVRRWRAGGLSTAVVPTMGALHEGHLSLVDIARSRADRVVTTIFVNPKQFSPSEDLATYPRDPARDLALLAERGTDLVFMPDEAEMYPPAFSTEVKVSGLTDSLCGRSRPHFFGGVATVVAKLLNQAATDYAVFGEKDYQQLLVVRRLARDLDIPTEILGGPIIREADGLAMSSRNAYLSPDERKTAGAFNRILGETAKAMADGTDADEAIAAGRDALAATGVASVDYVEVRHAETLDPSPPPGSRRLFGAIFVGKTRLIDNMAVPDR